MRTLSAPVTCGITCLICGERLAPKVNAGTEHRTVCPAWERLAARIDHVKTAHPDEWQEAQR